MRRLLFCGKNSSKWGVFALAMLWPALAFSQPVWSWAEGVNDGSDQVGFAIVTDDNSDNISTGYVKGTVDFDGNVVSTGGSEDIYLAKYDSSGAGIWAVAINGNAGDYGYGIAVDAAGNIYVCGTIGGSVTCYGSPNISVGNYGGNDIFIAKFSAAGEVLWAKHAGSAGHDEALSVCTDGNSVFITGYFTGTATFGSLPAITSAGGDDVFVAAYSCQGGTEQWVIRGGTSASDEGNGIAVDSSGVYIGGYYANGTCTFQNQSGSLSSNGGRDIFLVKYNLAGTSGIWMRRAGSPANDEGKCVTVRDNLVFVGGFFAGTMSLYNSGPAVASITAAGNDDGFIAQYDATTGNFSWIKSENGTGEDRTLGICTDPFGAVYATGYWSGTLPFGSGPSVSSSNRDVFVTAYDMNGNFLYGMRATGTSEEEGNGICASQTNDVFITGYHNSSNTQFGSTPQLNSNSDDIFIAKLLCDVTISNAGTNQNVCSPNCTLNGNTPVNGIGLWTLISGSGNILSPSLPGSPITSLGIGVNVFRWTIISGPCVSFDDVTITRYAQPAAANAGIDQTLCSSSVTLNANTPSAGSGVWSLVSGSGTITTPSSPVTTVTNLGAGQNVFEWSISNFSCIVTRDTVVIQSDVMPTPANAGMDQVICSSNSVFSGNSPSNGTGTWSVVTGGATITSPNASNSNVNNLSVGQNTFVWTTSNGVCPSSRDTMNIQVDANPTTAVAGPDQTICNTSTVLAGNSAVIGSGTWTLVSGSGTLVNPLAENSPLNSLGTGPNIFQWTIASGVCPSSADQVIINVDALPTTASAGSDQNLCSSSNSFSGNTPVTGSGMWSVVAGGGIIANPSSPVSNVTAMPVGVNTFAWTISNGVCPSSTDVVAFAVDPAPTIATTGIDHPLCDVIDTLTGSVPLVGTGVWTIVNGSGIINSPNAPVTAVTSLGAGVNEFVWTISNGTCPDSKDTMAITRYDFPSAAAAGADLNVCFPDDSLIGNLPLVGNGMWSVNGGGATLLNPFSPGTAVNDLTIGQNIFVWTISNGNCPVETDTVIITYNEAPSVADAGPDLFACGEQISLQASSPFIGFGIWEGLNGSPPIADSTNPNATLPNFLPGTWNYIWTTQNGFCISQPDTIAITVYGPPDPAVAGTDILGYNTTQALDADPINTGIGTWSFVQGSGDIDDIHDPHTNVHNLAVGVNILRWTASNGTCPENADELRIEILQLEVPNGFSPNGDGVNDNFEITGLNEFENVSIEVFNRWGNQVYLAKQYENNWNGTDANGKQVPEDIYYYVLKADSDRIFTGFIAVKRSTP